MIIQIEINSCKDCRHLDHSGAFTKGGAKPICGNHDACSQRDYKFDKWHWMQRVLEEDFKIPSWCPLKHGGEY